LFYFCFSMLLRPSPSVLKDAVLIRELFSSPRARILPVTRDLRVPIVPGVDRTSPPKLAWTGANVNSGTYTWDKAILLGFDGRMEEDSAASVLFAVVLDQEAKALSSAEYKTHKWIDPIHIFATGPSLEASVVLMARSYAHFHSHHGFCHMCGAKTEWLIGGHRRTCPSCKNKVRPPLSPVVIALVTHEDKCLIGRQRAFPPTMYSLLAGFVGRRPPSCNVVLNPPNPPLLTEPGETIQEAASREIFEEAGLQADNQSFCMFGGSQPWPFSASLMVGCHVKAKTTEIVLDKDELEDARWVSKAQVVEALRSPALLVPGITNDKVSLVRPPAIANTMLSHWANAL